MLFYNTAHTNWALTGLLAGLFLKSRIFVEI
jgi:hypothetical protein